MTKYASNNCTICASCSGSPCRVFICGVLQTVRHRINVALRQRAMRAHRRRALHATNRSKTYPTNMPQTTRRTIRLQFSQMNDAMVACASWPAAKSHTLVRRTCPNKSLSIAKRMVEPHEPGSKTTPVVCTAPRPTN